MFDCDLQGFLQSNLSCYPKPNRPINFKILEISTHFKISMVLKILILDILNFYNTRKFLSYQMNGNEN